MATEACKSTVRLLGAHLDGQLGTVTTLEVEDHVMACEGCRERLELDRALRASLKKTMPQVAPPDMQARMLNAMAAETARQQAAAQSSAARERGRFRAWPVLVPVASAAAFVVAWGAIGRQPTAAVISNGLLHDFVAQHSRPVPPEQQDPKEVRQFERYVGVPVRVRPQIQQNGENARFVGGRLVPVHGGERAAMLQYEMDKPGGAVQRVTFFVYDPRRVQVESTHLAPRAVGTSEVRVGNTDGYSVAVTQRGGVGYAMASDLDADSSARLVAAVDRE